MPNNFTLESGNVWDNTGFLVGAISGAMTVISAGADVFAIRNGSQDRAWVPSDFRLEFVTTTAFGAAQSLLFALYKVTGFTVLHTTGVKAITNGVQRKRIREHPAFTDLQVAISDTSAITGATYDTITQEPIEILSCASALGPQGTKHSFTVGKIPYAIEQNEGFVLRILTTMGATGVGNLFCGFNSMRV